MNTYMNKAYNQVLGSEKIFNKLLSFLLFIHLSTTLRIQAFANLTNIHSVSNYILDALTNAGDKAVTKRDEVPVLMMPAFW